eukprot:7023581-Alexandrium_andersonii.AAC.1
MSQQARVLRVIVGAAEGAMGPTLATPDREIYHGTAKPHLATQLVHNRLIYLARLAAPGGHLEA